MVKYKYKFNPDTLKYVKVRTSVKRTALKAFTFFTATVAVAILYYLIFSNFFSTPKERLLAYEINKMEENLAYLSNNLQQIGDVLADIQQRDSNIHRSIFESELIPLTVLRTGFRREALEGFSNTEILQENSRRIGDLLNQQQYQTLRMNELKFAVQEKSNQLLYIPSIQPIENDGLAYTAAGFGMRIHPIYRSQRFHYGIDFTAPVGTPIRATADGEIIKASVSGAQGLVVIIDHKNGYKTVYAHLDGVNVRTGQRVKRGDKIGTVGNSGMSTAPHLHYEIRRNDKPVDPVNYFFGELSPAAFTRIRDLSNLGRTFD